MSFDPSKYGLKVVDGPGGDGTFKADDGKYYQAVGFERNQKEGLDADKGDVFNSSLKKDSGIDVTSFNTINDVKQAVNAMVGSSSEIDYEPVEYSPEMQQAKDRVKQWEDEAWSGEQSAAIFGAGQNQMVGAGGSTDYGKAQNEAANVLAEGFKESIKRNISESLSNSIRV